MQRSPDDEASFIELWIAQLYRVELFLKSNFRNKYV